MNIDDYISGYSFEDVLAIEEQDEQFLALEKARKSIEQKYGKTDDVQSVFLLLVVQNGIVSFQIAGSGSLRWQEFSQKIVGDFGLLLELLQGGGDITSRWYDFLVTSQYNRRLYNIKRTRLKKLCIVQNDLLNDARFEDYYHDMVGFTAFLAQAMRQKITDKTIVFTTKMFGYAARIVFDRFVSYPMKVGIPVDSRLRRIYREKVASDDAVLVVQKYFGTLANKYNLPPLHLDSLLWLEYRERYMQ